MQSVNYNSLLVPFIGIYSGFVAASLLFFFFCQSMRTTNTDEMIMRIAARHTRLTTITIVFDLLLLSCVVGVIVGDCVGCCVSAIFGNTQSSTMQATFLTYSIINDCI